MSKPFCLSSEMMLFTAHTFALLMMSRVVNSPPRDSRLSTRFRRSLLSMLAAFQSFCYDNALPLSALHHRRANQQIQHCANPIHCRMRPNLANAGGGAGTTTTTTQRNTPGGLRGLHTLTSSMLRSRVPLHSDAASNHARQKGKALVLLRGGGLAR